MQVALESIRQWCRNLPQAGANQLRRRRPRPVDRCHLDEVLIKIEGKPFDLWRAFDRHGQVIDILRPSRRDEASMRKIASVF
ncbi:DDE-type integrase/transposase/recombinase [Rubidibacter lacunae]|uniref:DDE-type integrase/transposase/recombinase n=1 Tax=Rubidibacter lacunae TaxID=582514 RepID=UPI0009FD7EAF